MNRRKLLQITAGMTFAAWRIRPAAAAKSASLRRRSTPIPRPITLRFPACVRGRLAHFSLSHFLVERSGALTARDAVRDASRGLGNRRIPALTCLCAFCKSEESPRPTCCLARADERIGFCRPFARTKSTFMKPELAALPPAYSISFAWPIWPACNRCPSPSRALCARRWHVSPASITPTPRPRCAPRRSTPARRVIMDTVVHQVGNDAEPAYSVPTDLARSATISPISSLSAQ